MAARGLVKELWDEASCSICLDFFRDPMILTECGHNFCRDCLTQSWEELGVEPSCPQCRRRAWKKNLRRNLQLANFVEIARKFTLQEGKEAGGKGGDGKGRLCEKHQEPLELFCKDDKAPLCLVCDRSKEHRDHQVVPLGKEAREKKPFVAAGKERVCQKHQWPLKLFCKDDRVPICVVCQRSKEHRYHETLPLEEASKEYKDQFCSCLKILKKEREGILAHKGDVMKESQELLKQTKGERQKTLAKFRQLRKFLDEEEKLLLAEMEEVEKEVAKKRDQLLAGLSEGLSSLESLIREMEEKSQQPASDLLQDVRSTLRRYEEKERFENPVTFPVALKWRIWDIYDINHSLEGVMKQLKDGFQVHKANVTLDPDTAHPELILSKDQKSVRRGKTPQALPNNPERFDKYAFVLGHERFTAGRYFWDVLVGREDAWGVGVARNSVQRKGDIVFSPKKGFWEVGKWEGCYRASTNDRVTLQTPSGELKKIRVCLNYLGGRVAFFDPDRAALIYEFSEASFSGETLLPLFWVRSKGHLQLS
ncbi:PREDICTED: tripartite motif-containing protein 7-like [Gekko japonicus]|uniref:Tripartite motif-containing protein 7-like n=1 Tax=Gekko japonicus TaxID=146911 RepID=A0ABM1KIX8_GEKJA|nr:PREDICTED: tripartite motif-containing protein 7-like [Gekko japonicus]